MIVSGEVWLGLEKLHQLTSARDYKLQVKMKDWDDRTYIAVYDQFEVFDNPIQKTKQLFWCRSDQETGSVWELEDSMMLSLPSEIHSQTIIGKKGGT